MGAVAGQLLEISEVEERELRRRAGQYSRPYREVIRAKLVLLAARGLTDTEIAARVELQSDGRQVATTVHDGGAGGAG